MTGEPDIVVREAEGGWVAIVRVHGPTPTTHEVRVGRAERERYGGGDVTYLVRRAFTFLLAREPNTAILRRFDLGDIERYFPEFVKEFGPAR